jgi:hypothetical protein
MLSRITRVSGSCTTSGPGVYYVTAPGVTLTLETWKHWPDASQTITIKDMTGSATPTITVAAPPVIGGAIDGASSISMPNRAEGLVFHPYLDGITYGVTG